MTAAAINPKDASPEEQLRARALDTLRTATLETILESDEPLRTADVGRSVAERLDLDLDEDEAGGLASLVRMVLDSDPLFSQANRQWDLALRMGRAEGDRRKPVERAIEDFIDLLGHPAEVRPVAVLVSAVYGRDVSYYEQMLERLVATRPQFFRLADNRIAITRWLLDLSSDDPQDVEDDNFDDPDVVPELRTLAKGLPVSDPVTYARAIVEKSPGPVNNKALQFVTWCAFPDTAPEEIFRGLSADDVELLRGPAWATDAVVQRVLDELRGLAKDPESVADALAAAVPGEEDDTGILAPTTVRVSDEDLEQVHHYMSQDAHTYEVPELCQQVLEAFPGSRTYSGIHDSLLARMREDYRFQWVGFERFRTPDAVPAEVEVLPEGLAFDDNEYLGDDGEEVDRVVESHDWKTHLEDEILHPLLQDVGDDATERSATAPARIEASPPLHHYVLGTHYLLNSDRAFFPATPDVLQISLVTGDTRSEVWVNNRLGLIYGLKEWYDANLPWAGGKFYLEKGEQPEQPRLVYKNETEPLADIPMQRLQELVALRGEAVTEGLPLTEIVQRIVRAYPDGIHFVNLFREVNVVRRIRRSLLASVLSGQRYFQQDAQSPAIWHYDEKRAAKTKGKKKPGRRQRELYEDEDLELEVDIDDAEE